MNCDRCSERFACYQCGGLFEASALVPASKDPESEPLCRTCAPPVRILDVTILEALPSWNLFYSGMSIPERQGLVSKWHTLIVKALGDYRGKWRAASPEDYPLVLRVHVGKKAGVLDASNVCAKLAEDPLKRRIIIDDRPEFVSRVETTSSSHEFDFTRLVLEVAR